MRERKKTAPALQHQDGEDGQLSFGEVWLPENEFIISFPSTQGALTGFSLGGRANAITARELAQMTGKTIRESTRSICTERREGAPILSNPDAGFWLADSVDELLRCAAALHRRAGKIHATARALEQITEGRENA